MQFKRVLCPVDFSDFSVRAYEYALTLAEYYKAHLVALHAVELSKYPYADYVGATAISRTCRERFTKAAKQNCRSL